ncbi:MAG: sigma-70 family RNA polymerase sigma factor [Kiritimatiellae bacterium]|nr:sigma-70 family RNA polymerase sigma factor [Kiritimatiellia bacterium]
MNSKVLRSDDHASHERFLSEYDSIITSTVAWSKWRFDPHTQEDLAQKIRLEALSTELAKKPTKEIERCVRRLAISRCIDEVRRRFQHHKRVVYVEPQHYFLEDHTDSTHTDDVDPIKEILALEQQKALRDVLQSLGEPCAATLEDGYLKNLKYKEIAEKHGVNMNTVASRMSRCMDRLKK